MSSTPDPCCVEMLAHSVPCVEHVEYPFACPDALIVHSEQHGDALPVRDGGPSFVTIRYCPWCGRERVKP